jgi:hypothetical protein
MNSGLEYLYFHSRGRGLGLLPLEENMPVNNNKHAWAAAMKEDVEVHDNEEHGDGDSDDIFPP